MRSKYSGASLTEFVVAAPIIMFVGMATVQAALIYHGKTTLNYATFEAARTGAVNHAQVSLMVEELGQRLAPVQGGDGSFARAAQAMAQSVVEAKRPDVTRLEILNPTIEAFEDWGVNSQTTHHRVIPNSHLRHKSHEIGAASGLSLRDANLLKVKVTYGLDLKVPVVSKLIGFAMAKIDSGNAHFYLRQKFPLVAVATVRMQSEVWQQEIQAAREIAQPPAAAGSGNGDDTTTASGQIPPAGRIPEFTETPQSLTGSECDEGEYGLGNVSEMINTADYTKQACSVENPAFNAPTAEGLDHGAGC